MCILIPQLPKSKTHDPWAPSIKSDSEVIEFWPRMHMIEIVNTTYHQKKSFEIRSCCQGIEQFQQTEFLPETKTIIFYSFN